MKKILFLLVLAMSSSVFSQENSEVEKKERKGNKGKMYVLWGWNRGYFSDSDIHFKGADYDFVLKGVEGNDRITPFSVKKYLNPANMTIPQTNFRIGYFFHDNYTVSLGLDHMKYVMPNYKTVQIEGTINAGTPFDGVYNGEDILVTDQFLTFEHTDGLNYINIEVNRFDNLNELLNFETGFMDINLTEGIGGGVIYPKTNATLFGGDRYDDFAVSGYGLSAKVGLNLTFWDCFFIQSDYKVGYINMSDIKISESSADSASQDFTFFEATIMFGVRFQLVKTDN